MQTRTFKIRHHPQGRDEEVRRFTIEETGLTLEAVRARTKQLFKLDDDDFVFRWEDEDNDKVTLTEAYEFQDLLALKRGEQLIRLEVFVAPKPQPAAGNRVEFSSRGRGGHRFNPRFGPRFGARCDITNKPLQPGNGSWYHKPNTRNDLCPEEFAKLNDEEKKNFVLINDPQNLGADADAYFLGKRCPFRASCGGRRGQNHGDNEQAIGWCDVTDAALKVGQGWYHKVGTTYDLCETAFQKLSEDEKGAFVRVESIQDLGDEAHGYVRFPMMLDLTQLFGNDVSAPPAPPAPVPVPEPPKKLPKSMEIVSGPSVAAGAKVKAGSRLMPVWEVKNTAQSGLWTDVRLKPTAQNPFKISENGVEAPVLEAGASGIVSVDFVIPEDVPTGVVDAEFVLVDGEGETFGQPLTLNVEVVREEVIVDDRVRLLLDMGFADPKLCAQVLAENRGDVNAAALALLRGSRK